MSVNKKKAVVLDHCIAFSILDLYRIFHFQRVGKRTQEINLYTQLPKRSLAGSISITVNIDTEPCNDYVELAYSVNGLNRIQKIPLHGRKSNLGKGTRYYFICPQKKLKCEKLYLHGQQFKSKHAIENRIYLSQCLSRKARSNQKGIKNLIKIQNAIREAERPFFRAFYAGEPTNRYIRAKVAKEELKGYL